MPAHEDGQRSGRPRQYGQEQERRVLAQLEEPPPDGYATWNGALVAGHPGEEIHVVLDNLNTHKPKHDTWLSRQALEHSSFRSSHEVRARIDGFIFAYTRRAQPFRWKAMEVRQSVPRGSIAEFRE